MPCARGELRLNAELFPHEYFFLREHLPLMLREKDIHLVGEFVEALRAFGHTDKCELMREGMEFLMATQVCSPYVRAFVTTQPLTALVRAGG